jgi:tetratricopeptide (TPR) repeat protein
VTPLSLLAQRSPVRGHIVGADGKPLVGADVVLVNKDNGQKFTMKTDKKGDFMNIGVVMGTYTMTVIKDGQVVHTEEISARGEEKVIDINIPKAQAEQKEAALKQLTPEQRKQIEEQQKAAEAERTKISNLNQMLANADAAEKSGNYDQAISIYKQATTQAPTQPVLWARLGGAYLSAGSKVPAADRGGGLQTGHFPQRFGSRISQQSWPGLRQTGQN